MEEFKCPQCNCKYNIFDYIEVCDVEGKFLMRCEECEEEFFVKFKISINVIVEK